MVSGPHLFGQGNKLSIQISPPKNLSICGINDTATIQVYNISVGVISGIKITLDLPPGTYYLKGSFKGTGISENNISNLNQPVFNANNLAIANNFYFRVSLTAACGLYSYISGNNSPVINCKIDYTGNYDVGASLPFSVKVPSILISTITNQTFTGNVNDVFSRSITIGNYGKGPLRSLILTRINGKDLKTFGVNKGTNTYKADTVRTIFGISDFKKVGNLDTFLDQNETIIVTDTNQIIGCKFLTTNYELSWGCLGSTCQLVKNSGIVILSSQSPNIVTFPTVSYPVCFNGKTNNQLLKITNNGQKPAFKTRVRIDQGYYYEMSRLDTGSVLIKTNWKGAWRKPVFDSASNNYGLGIYACLGTDPIGAFRIQLGVINPKDTIYISFINYTCLTSTCNNFIYMNSWMYSTEYYDQCNNKTVIPMVWAKYYDYSGISSSAFTPTDMVDKQKAEFRHLFTYFYTVNYDATAAYEFDIVLPKGLSHNLNKNDFYINDANLTASWKPDSIRMKGDTARAYFSNRPFDLTNSELIYYLTADCSVAGSSGNQTAQLLIRYSPSKKCTSREWINQYCYSLSLKIHCSPKCSQGLKFTNFNIQRTSYGKPDNNNDGLADASGTIDLLKIREERAMVGDTITATYIGRVLKPVGSTVSWKYLYVESSVYYGAYLDIISADIVDYRGGTNKVLSCNTLKYKKIVSGVNATFKFDLSVDSVAHCVASGFAYKNTDSVRLLVKYKLTKNLGLASITTQFINSFYTSDIANPTLAKNKFQCDTFSGQMILTGYQFLNYGPDNYAVNSCANMDISQSFYLGIGSNSSYAGNNYFPFEYRSFARLKEILINLPTGFKLIKTILGQYRTSGSNVYTLETKDSIKSIYKNGKYSFETSKYYKDSSKGKFNLSDDAFQGYFYSTIQPSCELPPSTYIPISYDFVFEKKGTLGKGYDTINSLYYGHDQIIFNKPNISVKPTIPVNYASKDTAEWDIIYTNSSPNFSTLNCWFSPDNSGSIKIVDIRDGTKDTALKLVNGIYKAGSVAYNATRKFKVKAIYNSCKKDSIILFSGWNCIDYPKDLTSYTCTPEKTILYLEPQNTQFQVSISDSVSTADLCAQSPYYYLLENIGATNAYNTKAQLTLPIGMKVVSGKSFVKHPHKTGWIALPLPKLVSGTLYEWDLSKLLTSMSQGFKGITDTTKNKVIIRFQVQTDCNYSSGNYIRASAVANIKCGDKVLVFPAISNPLNIKGVTKPYFSLLKVNADTIFPCEKSTKVKVKIINLGPSKTGIEDKYQAILVNGMIYDSALFSAIRNAPDNTLTKTSNINGATEVEFSLPGGINPGDSIEFDLGFNSDTKLLNCGSADLYSQAAVKQEVICVADNSKCKINVVTGNTLLKIPILKGDLLISNIKTSLQSMSSDSETVNIDFTLRNIGQNILASKVTKLSFYYDKNNSGIIDSGDLFVKNYDLNSKLNKNASTTIKTTITIRAGYTCALFMAIDSTSCSCNFNQYRLPVPKLTNAGNDISFCSNSPNILGLSKVNGFSYSWQPSIDLNNDTLAQPSIIYGNIGSKKEIKKFILTTKRLTCYTKDTVLASIYQLPKINLIQKDTIVCRGQKVILKATTTNGTGKITTVWSPAIQVADSSKSITISTNPKTTRYIFSISDSFNCKAKDSIYITAKPYPKSNFNFNTVCYGDSLTLTDSSYITEDVIKANKWVNGAKDTLNSKIWKIIVPPTLQTNIKLISESPYQCKDTIQKTVTVKPFPKANFNLKDICFKDTAYFTNTSTMSVGSISQSEWQFGDNQYSTSFNSSHFYANADTFIVKLTVKSNFACADSISKNIVVNNVPKANFSVSDVCYGDSTFFTNTSTITNDSITGYFWDFDNTLTDKTINPSILYNKDTLYKVSLQATTAFGCIDAIIKNTTVNPLPKAIILTDTICEGLTSYFSERSTLTKGLIASRLWQLSDGFSSVNANFYHRFIGGDTFYIKYNVTSDKGCYDSTTGTSMVHSKMTPVIGVNNNCQGDTTFFTDLSFGKNTKIAKWKWIFSPTDSSVFRTAEIIYPTFGTNKIKLKITTFEGCVYDTSAIQTVYPLPVLSFANTNKCKDNQFDFQSTKSIVSGKIDSIHWDFGDGSTSNKSVVKHVFPAAASYNVVLTGTSNYGCKDSTYQFISSYPPVIVQFRSDSLCYDIPTEFYEECIVPNASISKYNWDFGDGYSDNAANPVHNFNQPGLYKIKLKITTSYNCDYDTFGYAKVYPVPVSIFKINTDEVLIINPVIKFSDSSIGADSILFDMGDGKYQSAKSFSYTYPDSGTFNVKHWAITKFGCIDSSNKNIQVSFTLTFYLPTAFTPNDDLINETLKPDGIGISKYEMQVFNRWGELIYFTDKSVPWDGKYQNEYVEGGNYAVVYKVYDYKGQPFVYRNIVTVLR